MPEGEGKLHLLDKEDREDRELPWTSTGPTWHRPQGRSTGRLAGPLKYRVVCEKGLETGDALHSPYMHHH